MNARGQYGSPYGRQGFAGRPAVGGIFHTVADREEARASLKRDVEATHQALSRHILHTSPENPWGLASDKTIKPEWLAWWQSRAVPFFNDFRDWEAARNPGNWTRFGGYVGYGTEFTTDWDVYKRWQERLIALREDASRETGISFSLGVQALPGTVLEDVEAFLKKAGEKVGSEATDMWKLAKYGIIGALVIGSVVALSTVAQDLRSGTDPSKRYIDFARRRGREAAALAL